MKNSGPDPMTCNADELIELVDKEGAIKPGAWPPALAKLVDVLEDYFAGQQVRRSRFWAECVAIIVSDNLGGRYSYLPRGDNLRRHLRNIRICKQFDGKNFAALAAEHRMTEMQIRKILKVAKTS